MTLTVAIAGLGYFSQFHLSAWDADPRTQIVALCDPDPARVTAASARAVAPGFDDVATMLREADPDILDIIAPPPAHADLIRAALKRGRMIVCQKPFCTSIAEAEAVAAEAEAAGAHLVIHENFRFQPWYRRMRAMLHGGTLGAVYQARFALRPGDGRGPQAYMDRQPGFQTMPRFLVQETAVHFIDTFRWLFGDITHVYAELRQINPAIAGEDAGFLTMTHASGVRSVFDGNRLLDHAAENQRLTMGEMEIESEGGVMRLNGHGQIGLRAFGGQTTTPIEQTELVYPKTFGGGCVANLITHVIDHLTQGTELENRAADYLHVMDVCEAAYASAASGQRCAIPERQRAA